MYEQSKLEYSRPFYRYRISDDPEIIKLVAIIYSALLTKGLQVVSGNKFKKHLMMVLLDLLAAYKGDPKLYISISRDNMRYRQSKHHKSRRVSFEYTMKVLDALKNSGYIEHHTGFKDIIARMTRIKAKPKLTKLFDKHHVSLAVIRHDPDREIIVLRDGDIDVLYEDTKTTNYYKSDLTKVNALVEVHDIDLKVSNTLHNQILRDLKIRSKDKTRWRAPSKKNKGKPNAYRMVTIDFTRYLLRRIFTDGSFELGGRFYGAWYQGIPSKYRRYITIDGCPTVELDYKEMHPTILYSIVGQTLVNAPYMLDGFDDKDRKKLKVVWNTMVNSPNAEVAKKSLQYGMPKASLPDGYDDLDDVFEAFKVKHAAIAEYFFSDYGKKLQYLDSLIANDVMIILFHYGVVCLPVHDSFIVDYRYEDFLNYVMGWVFMVHVGVKPNIKKDKTIFDGIKKNKSYPTAEDMVALIEQVKLEGDTGKDPFSKFHKRRVDKDNAHQTIDLDDYPLDDIFIL
tara:strand:+ start:4790 stop:6316 length:1527 start_codon:yes stop_codon:yes gene_type:complete